MHDDEGFGHPSSVPPDAIALPGTLYLYRDRARIIATASALRMPRRSPRHPSL